MCLLTVFPMPDQLDSRMRDKLENGAYLNPHGSGWAVVIGKRVVTGKSLDAEEAVAGFEEMYAEATGPAIFHSRWATHGERDIANTHPFPVRGMGDTYLAHNGIMPHDALPAKGDPRSDTRVFADEILPGRYPRLDSAAVRFHLDSWLMGNKVAVLTTNRRFRRNLYVFGIERGEWVDGVWFSNSDHEGYGRYAGVFSAGSKSEPDQKKCDLCGQSAVNYWDICEVCGTCQDCWEDIRDCQCFQGAGAEMVRDANMAKIAQSTPHVILGPRAQKAIEGEVRGEPIIG